MANGVSVFEDIARTGTNPLGAAFERKPVSKKARVVSPAPLPQEDPLATIKNVAGIIAQTRGGTPQGAPAGTTKAPFQVFDAQGSVVGTKGPESPAVTRSAPAQVTGAEIRQPEETTLSPPTRVTVKPTITPAPGVDGKAPTGGAGAQPAGVPATKGGISFLEDPDLQRALLAAGTSILEQADPTGAFTQVSRGALEGVKALEAGKARKAKAGKEERAEERAEKGLSLEERRVKVAERPKAVKDAAEERRIKAELDAAEEIRKEGGSLAEQLAAAEQARQLTAFAGGRGVIAAEGAPAETPGFISRLFGAEPKPATPPRIAFPRRRTATQQKVRQGIDQKQKTTFRDFLPPQ